MEGSSILTFNTICYAALSVGLMCLVLSPKIKDGVIIKAGLIAMALGFFFKAAGLIDGFQAVDLVSLSRSNALVNAGVIVVIVGYWIRIRVGARKRRRVTDWMDIDGAPSAMERRLKQ